MKLEPKQMSQEGRDELIHEAEEFDMMPSVARHILYLEAELANERAARAEAEKKRDEYRAEWLGRVEWSEQLERENEALKQTTLAMRAQRDGYADQAAELEQCLRDAPRPSTDDDEVHGWWHNDRAAVLSGQGGSAKHESGCRGGIYCMCDALRADAPTKHADDCEWNRCEGECLAIPTEPPQLTDEELEWAKGVAARVGPIESYDAPAKPVAAERPTDEAPPFLAELTQVINRHSMENGSNTPDFILAKMLTDVLAAVGTAITEREYWYGRTTKPAQLAVATEDKAGSERRTWFAVERRVPPGSMWIDAPGRRHETIEEAQKRATYRAPFGPKNIESRIVRVTEMREVIDEAGGGDK